MATVSANARTLRTLNRLKRLQLRRVQAELALRSSAARQHLRPIETSETLAIESVAQLVVALTALRDALGWADCFASVDPMPVTLLVYDDESALDRWTLRLGGVHAPLDARYSQCAVRVGDTDNLLNVMAHSMYEDLCEQLGLPTVSK